MAKVIFILGLCGSGKTILANKMMSESNVECIEDFNTHFTENYQQLVNYLLAEKDCIVIEIAYCIKDNRSKIIQKIKQDVPSADIEWICFEKDLDKAKINVLSRPERDPASHLIINQNLFDLYTFPSNAQMLPIQTGSIS